jgi:hypothetical protein
MSLSLSIRGKLSLGFAATALFACASLSGWAIWQAHQRAPAEVARDLETGVQALERALADEARRQMSIGRAVAVLPGVRAAAATNLCQT